MYHRAIPIGSSVQVQYMSLTKHNKKKLMLRSWGIAHWELTLFWYFAVFYFIGIYFDILHLIFCDSHRVGDGQKVFFDIVVEYSTCKYLGNYLDGKHNRPTTWYFSLKEKKVMSSYFKIDDLNSVVSTYTLLQQPHW